MTEDRVLISGHDASQAEDELRCLAGPALEMLLRSSLAMMVTDPRREGNPIVLVNPAFLDMTGYAQDEVIGRNSRFLQGVGTDRKSVLRMEEALASGQEIEIELRNYRRDGTPFWNRILVMPIRDPAGRIAFFLSSQLDVTAAHRAKDAETDLRIREERLQRVNESLRTVMAASEAAATWEWYIDENLLRGDAGLAGLLGLAPDELAEGVAPNLFFSTIHPQDRSRIRLAVAGMLRGAEIFTKEFRIVVPGGTVRWFHGRGRCTLDSMDRPIRFSGVLVDVSDQKRLEQQLRIAQSAGGVGTFEHVQGFATVRVSDQFCKLLGLRDSEELPLRTINTVVHPDDPPIIGPEIFAQGGAQGGASRIELRILRRDTGEERWLCRACEFVEDTEGFGARLSGVIYDITEAKRTEAALRTLNDTLEIKVAERTREREKIWRVSRDLLGVADSQGRWISINPAWTDLLGWAEGRIIGRSFNWLLHPDDQARASEALAQASSSQTTLAFETRLRHADGSYRCLAWTAVPGNGDLYCVGRDMTAERETASALREVEEKLRQSQKMEAVGQLTGGLAHDFNNLLTGISGSLELVQLRISQGRIGDVDRYVKAAQGASHRAAALTHRLLAFSRQQTLDPRATDMNRLNAGMEELIRRTVGPAISVEVGGDPSLWLCFVDANQLENALLNLCINARDAMPDGGILKIFTQNVRLGADEAQRTDLRAGDYVKLLVTDTGTGMTKEVMSRAFDPFFTTKPLGQGTGLGLSMIYGFVQQSGGHVRIDSDVGVGTTVALLLPRHLGEVEASAPVSTAPVKARNGDGECVLVVDDEATVRMLLADLLQEAGYTVIEAANGPEALETLETATAIDLMITDIGLPGGMNGRQVASIARALRPRLKVLFITGYAETSAFSHAHLEGGMHVLTKPFEIARFAGLVRQILLEPSPG